MSDLLRDLYVAAKDVERWSGSTTKDARTNWQKARKRLRAVLHRYEREDRP